MIGFRGLVGGWTSPGNPGGYNDNPLLHNHRGLIFIILWCGSQEIVSVDSDQRSGGFLPGESTW